MNKIKAFFRNLFSKQQDVIICKKNSDGYYAYRKVQNQMVLISGPYNTCDECKAATGATDCSE
ncbi:MAG: hypothetical protein V1775_10055 [Bacteroidota bacterium]